MEKNRFRCKCCHKIRTSRVLNQEYCGQDECQRARKNAWYREKYAYDPDYRANQRSSNKAWLKSKGGAAAYYREYRRRCKGEIEIEIETEAESVKSKLASSQESEAAKEDAKASEPEIMNLDKSANLDVSFGEKPFKSGRYLIIPEHAKTNAKLDAIVVEIAVISSG